MDENVKKLLRRDEYNVAIVCPLEVEMSAVRYMLDEEHQPLPEVEGDKNRYVFGSLSGHNVVIGSLPEGSQGVGAAARVGNDMRRSFPRINLRLLVGIGGGIPSEQNDVRLGDVVISIPAGIHGGVVQYDLGKDTDSGFERKGFSEPPPHAWRSAVPLMKSDHQVQDNNIARYIEAMLQKYPRLSKYRCPGLTQDNLFPPNVLHVKGRATCADCGRSTIITRKERESTNPVVHYGTIASGNRVIKDAYVRDKISADACGAFCVEMEAAGLIDDFHCIVVRGICDYADSHKNDDWHAYAAATAAGCAKELLTYMRKSIVEKNSIKVHFLVPNQRIKNFVGRDIELSKLETYFDNTPQQRPRIMVVQALGGQGKSQLVLEFCHRKANVYQGVFWINASSDQTIMRSLIAVAQEIGLEASKDHRDEKIRVKAVLQELARWKSRWMMVFDNCDDPKMFDTIRDHLQITGGGDILITSRHRGLERLGTLFELSRMPMEDALSILLRSYQPEDRVAARTVGEKIIERLGGLALAIDQAGSFIQYQEIAADRLESFITTYELQREEVLKHIPEDLWEYGSMRAESSNKEQALSAFTTWELSLRHLSRDNPAYQEAGIHMLTLSAFLASIFISERLFHACVFDQQEFPSWTRLICCSADPEPYSERVNEKRNSGRLGVGISWSQKEFWRFLQQARRLSLVQAVTRGNDEMWSSFSLHPLIRDWLQLRISQFHRLLRILETVKMVAASISVYRDSSTLFEERRTLALHIDALLSHNMTERSPDGRTRHLKYLNLRFESVLDWRFYQFAEFYELLGHWQSALEIYRCGLEASLRLYGPAHVYTTKWRVSIVPLLNRQAKYAEAESICQRVIKEQGMGSPEEIRHTVEAWQLLASCLKMQGKVQAAEDAEEKALEITRSHSIMRPDDIAKAMFNLAGRFLASGKFERGVALHREALGFLEGELGGHHIKVFEARMQLAWNLSLAYEGDQADRLSLSTLDDILQALGHDHDLHVKSMNTRAAILQRRGRWAEAEQLFQKVIEVRSKTLGPDHDDTLQTRRTLGINLSLQGRYVEAEKVLRQVLHHHQQPSQGGLNCYLLTTMVALAEVLSKQARYDEGWDLYLQMLEYRKNYLSKESILVTYMDNFAMTLYFHGLRDHAKAIYKLLMSWEERDYDRISQRAIHGMHMLARIYEDEEKDQKADLILTDIVENGLEILSEKNTEGLEILIRWANIAIRTGDMEAVEMRQRTLKQIFQQVLGSGHDKTLMATSNLAAVLLANSKRQDAEKLTLELYSTIRSLLKVHHAVSIQVLDEVVELLRQFGRLQQAHELEHGHIDDCARCAHSDASDID